jgi:hypothetical protein
MNSHLVTLYQTDVTNAVATLLGEIKERLIPHLPIRVPVAPHEMVVMGSNVRELLVHSTPVWKGNVRVTVTDDLVVIDVRDSDGRWLECWRSDAPNVVPQHTGAPMPKPVPAPEPPAPEPPAPEPPTSVQPGQVIEHDGYFTVAR